jgi:hypothetical protein
MCWLTVPQSSIEKLKYSDFRLIGKRKVLGKVRATDIYSDYFKSRGKRFHETHTLPTSDVRGLAIFNYITKRETACGESAPLVLNPLKVRYVIGSTDEATRYHKLMLSPSIKSAIIKNLASVKAKAPSIYIAAIDALLKYKEQGLEEWKCHQPKNKHSLKDYKGAVDNFVLEWPKCSFIKNSAIHSRTDKFRASYLLNFHSHNQAMEGKYQLDAGSMDFHNAHGLINRLVMNDFAYNVFINHEPESKVFNEQMQLLRETSERVSSDADELLARTKIITAAKDGKVNNINAENSKVTEDDMDQSLPYILQVIDSPETVVECLHYIAQVEKHYHDLLKSNPHFLEFTALPKCEWYERLIQNFGDEGLSEASVKQGKADYKDLAKYLPPQFENEIRG